MGLEGQEDEKEICFDVTVGMWYADDGGMWNPSCSTAGGILSDDFHQ